MNAVVPPRYPKTSSQAHPWEMSLRYISLLLFRERFAEFWHVSLVRINFGLVFQVTGAFHQGSGKNNFLKNDPIRKLSQADSTTLRKRERLLD